MILYSQMTQKQNEIECFTLYFHIFFQKMTLHVYKYFIWLSNMFFFSFQNSNSNQNLGIIYVCAFKSKILWRKSHSPATCFYAQIDTFNGKCSFKFCLMCQEKGWAQISQPRFENALYTWQIIASKFDKKGFGIPSFGLHILFVILNPTSISPQAPMKSKHPWLHCKCLEGLTGSLQGNQSAGISKLQGLQVSKDVGLENPNPISRVLK